MNHSPTNRVSRPKTVALKIGRWGYITSKKQITLMPKQNTLYFHRVMLFPEVIIVQPAYSQFAGEVEGAEKSALYQRRKQMKDGYLIKLLKLHKDIAIELKSQVVDLAEKMKEAYKNDVLDETMRGAWMHLIHALIDLEEAEDILADEEAGGNEE